MSSHDEYSDDEELFDETDKSEVYLGFVDTEIGSDDEDDLPTIEDTFIGGNPLWLHPSSKPDKKSLTCDNCGNPLALLLQAFAPINGNLYDRVIYIFGCKNTASCSRKNGSVKCIRGISKDPKKIAQIKKEQDDAAAKALDEKLKLENKKKLNIELTKDLFSNTASSNPFGSNPFGQKGDSNPFGQKNEANPFDTNTSAKSGEDNAETSLLKTNSSIKAPATKSYADIARTAVAEKPKTVKSDESILLPTYKGYFLYVDQERFKKVTLEPELEKYRHLMENVDNESEIVGSSKQERSSSISSNSSGPLNPQASKISDMLDDKYFGNFTNIVKHNPTQVLRYDLGGKPLLYSGKDDIAKKFVVEENKPFNVPNPGYNPSSCRQFELQLMPQAIMHLETYETAGITDILNGMSWGTIIVCTDVEDYIPEENFDEHHVGYIEEWCGVQWEESV